MQSASDVSPQLPSTRSRANVRVPQAAPAARLGVTILFLFWFNINATDGTEEAQKLVVKPLRTDAQGMNATSILDGCGSSRWDVDGIQLHVFGWRRGDSLTELLSQLSSASYSGWDKEVSMHIHVDGDATDETISLVRNFAWPFGRLDIDIRISRIGLRGMWLSSLGPAARAAGDNTLMVVFEDDMRVSSDYFQWLLRVVDAYGRNPQCRDGNLMGFSLSPNRVQETRKPFKRWHAPDLVDENEREVIHSVYLSQLPSSWGSAYWSDRWRDFARFVDIRMQPPYYDLDAEESAVQGKYDDLRLSPLPLLLPDLRSNVWPNSWKRFMIDFTFARGMLMLYPSLSGERGLASTLALSGEHTHSLRNDRTAPLVERLEPADLALPRYGDLVVLDIHLQHTTRERSAATGAAFLHRLLVRCPKLPPVPPGGTSCPRLVHAWARPGAVFRPKGHKRPFVCATDLYSPAAVVDSDSGRFEERAARFEGHGARTRYLLFEPEYGSNNQYFAIVYAMYWAAALGRQVVVPPLLLPRASAFEVASGQEVQDWPPAELVFRVTAGNEDHQLPAREPYSRLTIPQVVGFREWLKARRPQAEPPARLVRLFQEAKYDRRSSHLMRTLQVRHEARTGVRGRAPAEISLLHLFKQNDVKLEEVEELLGGCGDEVLAVQGMFFGILFDSWADWSNDIVLLSAKASALLDSVQRQLEGRFRNSRYACYHVRMGDYNTMCHEAKHSRSPVEYYNMLARQGYSCSVSRAQFLARLQQDGLPALVLSDSPNMVAANLKMLGKTPVPWVTSKWVRSRVAKEMKGMRAAGQSDREFELELEVQSMVIEQHLCARADISVLNRFSTVSRRIRNLQLGNRTVFWMTQTPAAPPT